MRKLNEELRHAVSVPVHESRVHRYRLQSLLNCAHTMNGMLFEKDLAEEAAKFSLEIRKDGR